MKITTSASIIPYANWNVFDKYLPRDDKNNKINQKPMCSVITLSLWKFLLLQYYLSKRDRHQLMITNRRLNESLLEFYHFLSVPICTCIYNDQTRVVITVLWPLTQTSDSHNFIVPVSTFPESWWLFCFFKGQGLPTVWNLLNSFQYTGPKIMSQVAPSLKYWGGKWIV